MATIEKSLRVLIVDDNRDGADALGLLVEALGNQVHVTYGGIQALDVATAFQPDLMLIDLVMPDIDGCDLAAQLRRMPSFKQTKIVAITGLKDDRHKELAMKAGCDMVLTKPTALDEIKAVLASVEPASATSTRSGKAIKVRSNPSNPSNSSNPSNPSSENRLPIDEARKIRSDRVSKALTQTESEAAICDGIIRFQEEYLGWRSDQVQIHFIKDLLVVRIRSVLTLAERQLGKTASPEKGRDLIKQTRKQLLELARPMLESLVYEAVGVKVRSMHHDISTVTGEEVIVFSFGEIPRFE